MKNLLRTLLICLGVVFMLPLFSFTAHSEKFAEGEKSVLSIGPGFAPVVVRTSSPSGVSYNFTWGTVVFALAPVLCFVAAARLSPPAANKRDA